MSLLFRSCSRNANLKRKRHAHPSYRYRPRFSQCRISACKHHHKHLLLVTNSVYHDLLRECSQTIFLSNIVDLDRHLSQVPKYAAIVIVHATNVPKKLHLDVINLMVSCLGNVSVWVDDHIRYFHVLKDCDRMDMCTNLLSLTTVIEQSQKWRNSDSREMEAMSSTHTDLYDSRWLPRNQLARVPKVERPTLVDIQMQLLAMPLCSRNRRFNIFYELNTAFA